MINISMKSSPPLTRQTIASADRNKVQGARSSQDLRPQNASAPASPAPAASARRLAPSLLHTAQKGQKVSLFPAGQSLQLKSCFGWNAAAGCDVDVSAFMLGSNGKVIGDDWFVFYGQTHSPDHSTVFHPDEVMDRESITIDLTKLHPSVSKIVFVLTIDEAVEKNLNFSMLNDAYIRVLDHSSGKELVSFKMDEYYANVTSMMIGEIYLHNGTWKFHAVGNGVARDLAGLCELYGVQVI